MPVRRILAALAALIVVAGAGYAAYWFHVAGELRKGIDDWAAERRAAGWTVAWAGMETGGFPAAVRIRLIEPRLVRPDGVEWRIEALSASAPPINLTRITLRAPGRHDVAVAGRAIVLTANRLRLDLDLDRHGRLRDSHLLGRGLTLTDGDQSMDVAVLSVSVQPAKDAPKDQVHEAESLRFTAAAHGIVLPETLALVLEREVALAEMSGRVLGTLPLPPSGHGLMAWAAEGGTIEIDHMALDWAPMALEAEGTLALDPRGQPLAALSAKVRGFSELMDRLAERRVLDAGAATAAKLMLSLMAKPDARGRPAVPVPVTLQDGGVWFGPARVADMPPLPLAD